MQRGNLKKLDNKKYNEKQKMKTSKLQINSNKFGIFFK